MIAKLPDLSQWEKYFLQNESNLLKIDWTDNHLLSDEELSILKKYKVWGKKKFMGKEFLGIIRSTFLIGKKGETIKFISMNARKSIEMFTGKKVDLFLDIKIKKKARIGN